MRSRLSRLKTNPYNRPNFSTTLSDSTHHFSHTLPGKYSHTQKKWHSTTTPHYQPRIKAPIIVDELNNHLIEDWVDELDSLQKATLTIFIAGNISHGSIGLEAHVTLAEAINRIAMKIHGVKTIAELRNHPDYRGPISGSGEGGQLGFRYNTLWDSMMKQIASGRFGVTSEYLATCHEIQIKVAQGAKPGVGGELPGSKITVEIAFARLIESDATGEYPTMASASLNNDVASIEDLKQLIFDLRSANPKAKISVKIVATYNIGVIAVGVAKCGANHISIAGPGGTGAATLTAKHEFTPTWEAALAEAHQALIQEGLRQSVRLTTSGGIQTGEECFKAVLLGADGIELGTELLVAMGCINAKLCHNDTCPTGIATNKRELIDEAFKGKPEHVGKLLVELAKSTAYFIEYYGYSHPSQVVGQTQLLEVKKGAPVTGLEALLHIPHNPYLSAKLERAKGSSYLEKIIIQDIARGVSNFQVNISNSDLTFGARIAYHTHEDVNFKNAFYKQPVTITFNGDPGQSFGFVAPANLTMITNNTNDGTGKSLDGATLIIKNSAGNQTGYGGTRGEIFTRFSGDHAFVRNSGVHGVCESLGEMGVNFMTGGSVTIFGTPDCYPGIRGDIPYQPPVQFRQDIVGPNFGASFTGGYVILPKKLYESMYHHGYLASHAEEMQPQELSDEDATLLFDRLTKYAQKMPNPLIDTLLLSGKSSVKKYFVKLSPKVKYKNLPPRDPSVELLVMPQSLPEITPAPKSAAVTIPSTLRDTHTTQKNISSPGLYNPERPSDACGTGVIANREGKSSHELVIATLDMLEKFMHRGATGIDPMTGDGCGVSFFGIEEFFASEFPKLNLQKGNFGIAHIALPKDDNARLRVITLLDNLARGQGLDIQGQRNVPIDSTQLGYIGQKKEPIFKQCIIIKPDTLTQEEFEKKLIRMHMQFELKMQKEKPEFRSHIISCSSYHVTYKALTTEDRLRAYFRDFLNRKFKGKAGVCHSRFSTNTLPAFENIQPFKFANNGENNALHLLIDLLSKDPLFKNILDTDHIDLLGLSDSHIMSIYMNMLHLLDYTAEEIVASTIHKYEPEPKVRSSDFYNLFGIPFEGPNATILMMNDKIVVVGDKNRFRPQRGMMNDELIYVGSENGPVQIEGVKIDLPPAKPLIIDLANNQVGIYKPLESVSAFHHRQMSALQACTPDYTHPEPIQFSESELQLRKTRAGWTDELHEYFMKPLFKGGKGLLSSMGNQGPTEAFVRGAYSDIYAYFYGKFSQVTNPPLAIKEERAYMSTKVFVGKKPSLQQLGHECVQGYELLSPIVDNHEMELLKKNRILKTNVVDCIFPVRDKTNNMEMHLENIAAACVEYVRGGATLLVLSDIESNDYFAALPPVIVASMVHDALLKAGLRRNVSIALQSGSVLTGREVAQAISIGGVDIINPYLAFIPSDKIANLSEFRNQGEQYKAALTYELLAFMARMGISTVSAYRGSKGFYGYGVNADLAEKLGINSIFGGMGLTEFARSIITWHQRPKKEGLGRYDDRLQDNRPGIWGSEQTSKAISVARADGKWSWSDAEKSMNATKAGFARGWLKLKPSQVWNQKNPMRIAIIGAGAAGLNAAKAILSSGLPVLITIYERNPVNPNGLIGNGVAPDHPGTKNYGKLLREPLEDKRVKYRGGLEIGKDVSMEDLKSRYTCIVNCSGAPISRKLNVKGESLPGVISPDAIYKSYNNMFNPLQNPERDWHFFPNSKSDVMSVLGMGNVAADVTRAFLNQDLEGTSINPRFLEELQRNPPTVLHVIGNETPDKTRFSLNQLENLAAKKVWITAHFDCYIDEKNLTKDELKLYQFFLNLRNNTPPIEYGKQIHFHFGWTKVEGFEEKGDEIECVFTNSSNQKLEMRSRCFVTAIGTVAVAKESNHNRAGMYECGWAENMGGALTKTEADAKKLVVNIKRDLYEGKLNHLGLIDEPHAGDAKCFVDNQEQLNMLDWLEDGNFITTSDDFIKARQYRRVVIEAKPVEVAVVTPVATAKPEMQQTGDPDGITLVNSKTGEKRVLKPSDDSISLYAAMKESNKYPHCACGGEQVCGDCNTAIIVKPVNLNEPSQKEAGLHKGRKTNANQSFFACIRKVKELKGGVFEDPAVGHQKNMRS